MPTPILRLSPLAPPPGVGPAGGVPRTAFGSGGLDRRGTASALRALDRALERLRGTVGFRGQLTPGRLGDLDAGQLRSASPLDLSGGPSYTTLVSSGELNPHAHRIDDRSATMGGASTVTATIDGAYDGSLGSTTLEFRSARNSTVGASSTKFDVYDTATGQQVDTLNFGPDPAGTVRTTVSGLAISLGDGIIVKDDSFFVQVTAGAGESPDATNPLGGSGLDDARLEYGMDVVDGSFEVNGTTIAVSASDSLQDVLDRITASAAGVDASYDALTEQVTLTQRTGGAAATITVGNDSSGFLAAARLDDGTLAPASDNSSDEILSGVASLSGVRAGNIAVNGTVLAVDPATDSLLDVLGRIDALEGVEAGFDGGSGEAWIRSTTAGGQLELAAGTSGFLGAIGIAAGRYGEEGDPAGPSRPGRRTPRDANQLRESVKNLVEKLGVVFGARAEGSAGSGATVAQGRIRSELSLALAAHGGPDRAAGGLRLDDDAGEGESPLAIDPDRFARALRGGPGAGELEALLLGRGDEAGLLDRLAGATGDLLEGLAPAAGTTGGTLDLYA